MAEPEVGSREAGGIAGCSVLQFHGAQSLLEPSYDLARAPNSEGKGVSKDFASFHGFPWQKRSPG